MEEHSHYAPDEVFWVVWSNPHGQRIGYTHLCDGLQCQCVAHDTQHAAAAHSFFGGDLDCPDARGAFRYIKSGTPRLMSKDIDIARKWRELLTSASIPLFPTGAAGLPTQMLEAGAHHDASGTCDSGESED